MEWLKVLLGRKERFDEKNKKQLNRLFMVAVLENRLEPSDINLLTAQLPFIEYKELPDKKHQINTYKKSFPRGAREKFNLIFQLVTSTMKYGALSERKEQILSKIIETLHLQQDRTLELITFVKSNIRNGLNEDDSYLRLGYLLKEPKYV